MARVDVISASLVPMATNANPMPRLDLTPWDLQFLLLDPIQKGILFHKPEPEKAFDNIIDHLKTTLSHTLDSFPPLAGRLGTSVNNDKNTTCYFLDCNNAGAEFTHATADGVSVSDILEAKYIPEIVSSFFPLNGLPNCDGVSKPLLGVQVTELADGYFISCTGNHAVIDGASFWHFFNSWSELSRGFGKISKTPVFERWFSDKFKLPICFPPLEQNILPNFAPPQLLERVFHFSKENVAKLKAKANSEAGTDKISSLQAVSANLWRSVVRCRHLQNVCLNDSVSGQDVFIGMLVGARARIPLAEGYFGNAVYVGGAGIGEAELMENGLGHAAMRINEFVGQQTGESARRYVEDWVKNPVILKRGSSKFVISSSPRHNVYGTDFGWGRPIAVRSGKGQKFDGKMTVFPAAEAGGIDVEVCLAPETMLSLEVDAEFIETLDS